MPPPLPRTIGRYALIDRLGHGGMGVVYRAWDPDLRRMVALKIIAGSREAPIDDSVFERFAREAQSAASLAHQNIVTIYDFGRDGGRPYIVMELVDGESMAQMIQGETQLPLSRRVRLAAELCEGLAYAHDRGVIHRDVKPANLMITAGGVLKILDFGLARLTDDLATGGLTQAGAVMGTPQYMSPEQISGLAADARSDIFAVGTVLYELFTGQMAFAGQNSALIRLMILHDSPRPMSELVPGFPPRLSTLIGKAMEKDRSRRYQTLDELAADLRDWEPNDSGDDGAKRTSAPESEAGEPTGSPALSGVLAEWENLVGRALDEPTPTATPAGRDRHAADSGTPIVTSPRASTGVRAAAAPGGKAPSRKGVTGFVVVALVVGAVLAAIGVYLSRQPGTLDRLRTPTAQEPRVVPEPVDVPASSGGVNPNLQRPATPEPRTGETQAAPRANDAPRPNRTDSPALSPQVTARCTEILQRVGIGEELTATDRDFLTKQCRDRSR